MVELVGIEPLQWIENIQLADRAKCEGRKPVYWLLLDR